ncbi:MAG TPA: hypothetical protein VNE40_04560 [Candidatus Dormibacteraeota bacterium]|nr:hypothetical protein [Candidatus Dormibacteraeota bacterium]
MAKVVISKKRLAIDKANTQMVIVLAVASFLTVFSLVAGRALLSQSTYQSRVIAAKQKAVNQLKINVNTVGQLVNSYDSFVSTPSNIIGGSTNGTGSNDGDNAKIVLDALPSQYDFPALTSSLEKILTDHNFKIDSISGTDDELAQQNNQTSSNPQPIPIPFNFSISQANYSSVQDLISLLQRSIRPIQIDTLTLSGGQNSMQLSVSAHTYYQPEKDLKIKTQVIK